MDGRLGKVMHDMAETSRKSNNERVYRMAIRTVYPLYAQKAEKKGRTQNEVDEVIMWLTGYDRNELGCLIDNGFDLWISR